MAAIPAASSLVLESDTYLPLILAALGWRDSLLAAATNSHFRATVAQYVLPALQLPANFPSGLIVSTELGPGELTADGCFVGGRMSTAIEHPNNGMYEGMPAGDDMSYPASVTVFATGHIAVVDADDQLVRVYEADGRGHSHTS